jgi:cytochrome c biogenesis protein CcmG/thiol:disulfide interchange protein DsbE
MRFPGRALVVLALLAVVVAVEVVSGGKGRSARPAPALPAQVLQAPRVTLATLRGKPALINFWASWCGPCKREAPALVIAAKRLSGRAALVGVDWGDNARGAGAFIRRHGWTCPILRDATSEVRSRYGIGGLPTTFVIDSSGRIVQRLIGPQSTEALVGAVSAAG